MTGRNNLAKKWLLIIVLIALVTGVLLILSNAGTGYYSISPKTLCESSTIHRISAEKSIPEDRLIIHNAMTTTFPYLNKTVCGVTAIDRKTGLNYSVDLDENLQPVDTTELANEERWESFRRSGKIDPWLLDMLNTTHPKEYRTLWIVMNEPPDLPQQPVGDYVPEETMKEFYRLQAGVYANHTRQISDLVNSHGAGVIYTGRFTPSLAVRIPMSNADELEIVDALNRHPAVVLIIQSKIDGPFNYGRVRKMKAGSADGVWIYLRQPPGEIRNSTENTTEQYRTWSAPVVDFIRKEGYAVNENVADRSPQILHTVVPPDIIEELSALPQIAALELEGVDYTYA